MWRWAGVCARVWADVLLPSPILEFHALADPSTTIPTGSLPNPIGLASTPSPATTWTLSQVRWHDRGTPVMVLLARM